MDRTLELLSTYACELTYEALPAEVVHQVKRTLIDTLGCAIGAFHAEPSRIAPGIWRRASPVACQHVCWGRVTRARPTWQALPMG
jgi:2-methylcitrate dehydratase